MLSSNLPLECDTELLSHDKAEGGPEGGQLVVEIAHVGISLLLVEEGHQVVGLLHEEDAVRLGLYLARLCDQPVCGRYGNVKLNK